MNAVRLQMDWRPLLGVRPADAGSLVEQLLAHIVTARAVEAHNEDVSRSR